MSAGSAQPLRGARQPKIVENAKLIVREYIELLGHRDYALLMQHAQRGGARRDHCLDRDLIQDLREYRPESTDYVVPDVIVTKHANSGKWKVELNPETAPKIRINSSYASLVKRADTSLTTTSCAIIC